MKHEHVLDLDDLAGDREIGGIFVDYILAKDGDPLDAVLIRIDDQIRVIWADPPWSLDPKLRGSTIDSIGWPLPRDESIRKMDRASWRPPIACRIARRADRDLSSVLAGVPDRAVGAGVVRDDVLRAARADTGAVVLEVGLELFRDERARRVAMPLASPGPIPPGERVVVESLPVSAAARLDRLMIAGAPSDWVVRALDVAGRPQLAESDCSIPGEVFLASAFDPAIVMDRVPAGGSVSLAVSYVGRDPRGIAFLGTIIGEQEEKIARVGRRFVARWDPDGIDRDGGDAAAVASPILRVRIGWAP